jgi:hypothetical protein
MNGIYLTEQGKEEIEAKIQELKKGFALLGDNEELTKVLFNTTHGIYHRILSSATVLPVEETWELICNSSFVDKISPITINNFDTAYSNGVIIQPKQ